MTKHKVYVKRQRQGLGERNITSICRRAVKATLLLEEITIPCQISVLLTDDEGIQEINLAHRQIGTPTDVLSFPTGDYVPGHFQPNEADMDPETGYLHLGDIVISSDRVDAQAREYGHETTRELSYLMVHATLHLLGYDHEEKDDYKLMRSREELILGSLGLMR